jgi:8-oxo-dGTP diphosphatase
MRKPRPAARLLIVDPEHHVLMFRFDAGDGRPFWATPGGACDPGETFYDTARREMAEETGISLDPGPEVARRQVAFTTIEGDDVWADERYFLVQVPDRSLDTQGHTALEQRVMTTHRWWSLDEIRESDELIFPKDVADLVEHGLGDME